MKLTKKEYIRINQVLRDRNIHWDQVKHINCVRPHPTESDEHAEWKHKECRKLYKMKHPYLTEVWTFDRKIRYDILDLKDDIDIEIDLSHSSKKYKGDKIIKRSDKHGR